MPVDKREGVRRVAYGRKLHHDFCRTKRISLPPQHKAFSWDKSKLLCPASNNSNRFFKKEKNIFVKLFPIHSAFVMPMKRHPILNSNNSCSLLQLPCLGGSLLPSLLFEMNCPFIPSILPSSIIPTMKLCLSQDLPAFLAFFPSLGHIINRHKMFAQDWHRRPIYSPETGKRRQPFSALSPTQLSRLQLSITQIPSISVLPSSFIISSVLKHSSLLLWNCCIL